MDARSRPPARCADPGHAGRLPQFAQQSDRLDARRGRPTRDPRPLPPARHLDRRRRRLRAPAITKSGGAGTWRPRSSISSETDDRVVSTNTFSKSWLMTGWRLGWIVAPARARSGSRQARRVQHVVRAAVRPARRRGRGDRRRRRDRANRHAAHRRARDVLRHGAASDAGDRGGGAGRARCTRSFASRSLTDSLDFCKRLVAGDGTRASRPGIAFGPEGEGFVRWCFASSAARLTDWIGCAIRLRLGVRRVSLRGATRTPSSRRRSGRRPSRRLGEKKVLPQRASAPARHRRAPRTTGRLPLHLSPVERQRRSPERPACPAQLPSEASTVVSPIFKAMCITLFSEFGGSMPWRRLVRSVLVAHQHRSPRRASRGRTRPPLRRGRRKDR